MENLQKFLKEIEERLNSVVDAELTVMKFSTTPPSYGYIVRAETTKNADGVLSHRRLS